jgi:hypothetical protein
MQRLGGLLLVLAGTAMGGYMAMSPASDGAEKLAEVTRISAAPDRETRAAQGPRLFSPASPLIASADAAPLIKDVTTGAITPGAPPKTSGAWSAVVTADPGAQNGKLTSSKPGDAETRAVLARDLQQELKRVGCYGGDITGTWTPSTKRAMAAFMDRVNATLPVEEPDYILLTLVQGHTAAACGAGCRSGEVLSEGGRCLPQAVVAQATRKTQREELKRANDVQKTAQQERFAGEQRAQAQRQVADARRAADEKRALDDKKAADQRLVVQAQVQEQKQLKQAATAKKIADELKLAQSKAAVAAQVSAQVLAQAVAAAEPETLPWLKDQPQTAIAPSTNAPVADGATRRTALPGMMAMGGPRDAQPPMAASVAAVTPDRGPGPDLSSDAAPDNQNGNANAIEETPALIAPAPVRAVKPAAKQTVQGLPGKKLRPSVRRVSAGAPPKYRPARIVRRPAYSPRYVTYRAPKVYYYASNTTYKRRRNSGFNLIQALGWIN